MPNKNICMWLLVLLLICNAALAYSQDYGEPGEDFDEVGLEDLYGDEELVSIATGSQKPVYKAPAVASVITSKQIRDMGARTLEEVLETVPGLHITPSALSLMNSIYSIRGIHTGFNPQVLVLMNGVPFPLLSNGGRPHNFQLPVSSIARVEVLRGPGSAVFGADAFAGVINIITKNAKDVSGTETGVRYGSFATTDVWGQHGGQYGELGVMFSLEWQQSDGDRDRKVHTDLQSVFDTLNGTSASYAPGPLETRYNVLDAHLELSWQDWTLRQWYSRQHDAGLGTGSAQALDPKGYTNNDIYMFDLTWNNQDLLDDWAFSAGVNYYYLDNQNSFVLFPPGTVLPIGADGNVNPISPTDVSFPAGLLGEPGGENQQIALDLASVYSGFKDHRIRLGMGMKYQKEDTRESKNFGPGVIDGSVSPIGAILTDVSDTPFVFQPDTNRTIFYLSVQDEWQLAPDWELTGGLRYDHYSDFGQTLNPRIALVWATNYNLTTKLLYGRAFRAPSFGEQFQKNNPIVLGNPDLEPETIDTLELAFDYRPRFNISTNLSLFGYRANGLIEFVNGQAQNARDQQGYGFELEARWEANEQLTIGGSYAWQHSEDVDSGKRVADAPGQQLLVSIDWFFASNWLLHPQARWIGSRPRTATDTRPEIDDYLIVDVTLRHTVRDNLELTVAARNLFDEAALEPSDGKIPGDLPLEGCSLWAEMRYHF